MLRQIERATRQPIEEMQLSVEAVNDTRINKFTSRISEALGAGGLDFYRQLLERFENEQNVPAIEIAAALAKLLQGDTPFLLQPPVRAPREERAPRERFDRGDRRNVAIASSATIGVRASSAARVATTPKVVSSRVRAARFRRVAHRSRAWRPTAFRSATSMA